MTLADLIREARRLGDCFTSWEIPLDKEVQLELIGEQGSYTVKVCVKEPDNDKRGESSNM
jgi:hypothetical protein